MKLKTLIQNSNHLEVAEVEIELIPGIPQIHFLGLPDRIIKESFYRIKSALKSSGYKFPLTSQMIVNIKPNHLRKSSRGLELAVALGILLKTDQISADLIDPEWVIYGELGLDGQVYEPTDLQSNLSRLFNQKVLTGQGGETGGYRLPDLKNMEIHFSVSRNSLRRPAAPLERLYNADEAEFLFLAATTGLHGLLAGDSGAGKTTLAHSLIAFMAVPGEEEIVAVTDGWRPVVEPHHSVTPAAFLGGGGQLYTGEVERAQGGLLLLDELLEFSPEILEALRVPMSGEKLRLARGGNYRESRADFQVIATTNLCPCGKWTPMKKSVGCRFSRKRCVSYLDRFSGPVLDRFGLMLIYSHPLAKREIRGREILERIRRVREVSFAGDQKPPAILDSYYKHVPTRRRFYLDQVADAYRRERNAQGSSGERHQKLCPEDYGRAERWVIGPFEKLEKGMS